MKKITEILLCVLVFSLLPGLSLATNPEDIFSDLSSDDPSLEAIEYLSTNNIVDGYPDGTFKSQNKINRAEFMKIVVETITDEANGSNCFPDVQDEWFAKYVCYGHDLGIVDGYSDGTFKPNQEINFAEASKILTNAFELTDEETAGAAVWYKPFVKALEAHFAIPFSISDLDKSIARGEMAEVVWRIEANKTDLDSLKYEELEGVPLNINSCDELKDIFLSHPEPYYYFGEEEGMDVATEAVPQDDSAQNAPVSEVKLDEDYSSTNVQVAGVDEADIVKNDGQYIYMLKDSSIRIIEAYPPESMKQVSEIIVDDTAFSPNDLYLDGDTLTLIGTTYSAEDMYDYGTAEIWFPYYHQDRTAIYIYDIADRARPTLKRNFAFDGSYNNSRKVDDTLYLILNKYDFSYYSYGYDPENINVEEVLPRYFDSKNGQDEILAGCTDIRYFPRERDLNYLMTIAVPLESEGDIVSEVMIGSSENIYASRENLYVAATNYDSTENYYYDWSNAKTLVYRFALTPGSIAYQNRGKISGTILNQFSMDEYGDYFRIASQRGEAWDTQDPSTSNLYILNRDMETVGSIEGIAPGEQMHSSLFMGDRGYMVTFKKVDPFFVFDLSDPENPRILGELKIPGYSDYLEPYDENHIIGFGKDAEDAEEEEIAARELNFAWYQGLKIGLFDVTDPTNPKQTFSVGIGDRGTDSPVLYDAKALLFDASKNLLAFPVSLYEIQDENAPADTYGEFVYQGAYVYTLDLEKGFNLRGKISHFEEGEIAQSAPTMDEWGWSSHDYQKEIQRILYIGKHLYTTSQKMIKSNNMDTVEEENRLNLE